jgi:hypothetical protein
VSHIIGIALIWFLTIHLSICLFFHWRWGSLHFSSRFAALDNARASDDETFYGYWKPILDRFEVVHDKFNHAVNLMAVLNYVRGLRLYNEALEESKALEQEAK